MLDWMDEDTLVKTLWVSAVCQRRQVNPLSDMFKRCVPDPEVVARHWLIGIRQHRYEEVGCVFTGKQCVLYTTPLRAYEGRIYGPVWTTAAVFISAFLDIADACRFRHLVDDDYAGKVFFHLCEQAEKIPLQKVNRGALGAKKRFFSFPTTLERQQGKRALTIPFTHMEGVQI